MMRLFWIWMLLALAARGAEPAVLVSPQSAPRFLPIGAPYASLSSAADGLRIEVTSVPPKVWNVQLSWPIEAAVEEGDVIEVAFDVQCLGAATESGEGMLSFDVQRMGPPWLSLAGLPGLPEGLTIGRESRRVRLATRASASVAAGGAMLVVNFGQRVQTVRLANFTVLNHGPERAPAEFASPHPGYDGRAPDAPWRRAAAERIERLRKADLVVTVTDPAGRPVAGAEVRVAMRRHAFPFGTVVNNRQMLKPENDRYRETVERYFNRAVFEGAMKWREWESGEELREGTDQIVEWLRARGIVVRGHTLIWPVWQTGPWKILPENLRPLVDGGDREAVRARIRERIAGEGSVTRRFAGRLAEWDVLNEPTHNKVLQDFLGEGEMAEWFRLARAADPAARLYVNDYAMLSGGAVDDARIDEYHRIIARLIADGAPLDGIGEQAHFGHTLVGMERARALLDRFAEFGRPIQITEFDVALDDEAVQADFTRDFLTLCFSHPAVEGFLFWGFWEGSHWMPTAALWRADWTLKPNGQAFLDLVFRDWWTDERATTDAAGRAVVRGFLGRYEVTAETAGRSASATVELTREGGEARLVLGEP